MPFTGIANPSQMRVMTEALGIYCQDRGILNEDDRGHVAEMIVSLFFSGRTTTEELLEALKNGHLQPTNQRNLEALPGAPSVGSNRRGDSLLHG